MKTQGKLSELSIAQVRDISGQNLVDIVTDSIILKRSGREYMGCCPFHDDSTPSFSVSPEKGLYHCHGCNVGGDAIAFIRAQKNLDFVEAVEELASRFNIPVEYADSNRDYRKEKSLLADLYRIHSTATEWFQQQLTLDVRKYLADRDISEEAIATWQLGYAPESWDSLFNYLKSQGYSADLIERAGLIIKRNDGGYHDRFRNRLMVPIYDRAGRVIAFTGRTTGNDNAKYLNSPETLLFQKSNVLFGFHRFAEAVSTTKTDIALVVEGHLDVISLHSRGIPFAVGTMGTAINQSQIKQLAKHARHIVLNFDGDKAGIDATEKAIAELHPLLASNQINLNILQLPDGQDPDQVIRDRGTEAYRELIANSINWVEWKVSRLCEGKDLTKVENYSVAAMNCVDLIASLNPSVHGIYVNQTAKLLAIRSGSTLESVHHSLNSALRLASKKIKVKKIPAPVPAPRPVLDEAELMILAIASNLSQARHYVIQQFEEFDLGFSTSAHRRLFALLIEDPQDSEAVANLSAELEIPSVWMQIQHPEDQLVRAINYLHIQLLIKQRSYSLQRWAETEDFATKDIYDREAAEIWNKMQSLYQCKGADGVLPSPALEADNKPLLEEPEQGLVAPVEPVHLQTDVLQNAKPEARLVGLAVRKLQQIKTLGEAERLARTYSHEVLATAWGQLDGDHISYLSREFGLNFCKQPSIEQYIAQLESGTLTQDEAVEVWSKAEALGTPSEECLNRFLVAFNQYFPEPALV
jgi:DNA primase